MSIFNRRNAALGWATWAVGKQAMKRKAKPPASKRRRTGAVAAALAGVVGVALFWRSRGGDDVPPTD